MGEMSLKIVEALPTTDRWIDKKEISKKNSWLKHKAFPTNVGRLKDKQNLRS